MNPPWSGQLLTELLGALTECADERAAATVAVARTAATMGAQVAALIPASGPCTTAGTGAHLVEDHTLRHLAATEASTTELGTIGRCEVLVSPLDRDARLLVLRAGPPFSLEEAGLLGGTGQVLNLTVRQLRLFSAERTARHELQVRQRLLEHLYRIQQAISRREPLEQVLDAICRSGADLLGDVVAGVRLVDRRNPTTAPLVTWVGTDDELPEEIRVRPTAAGVSGRAIREGRLVVEDAYRELEDQHHWYAELGVRSAMAAPVTRDNHVVGAMVISSLVPRSFGEVEQETLLTLAEHVSLALNDASALRNMADALDDAVHQATHDPLTGLPNRTLVLERLDQAMGASAAGRHEVTLLFIDLDRFKRINDYLGHGHGDAVLVAIADRLRSALRTEDTVGRLGGDEFVVVAEDLDDDEVDALAARLADAISQPVHRDGRETIVTASIGIARATAGMHVEDVLGEADVALYRAKDQGRSRIERFDLALRRSMADRSATEQALHQALRDDQLRAWYQPAVRTDGPRPVAVEALLRWQRPDHGLVAPDRFIGLAEDTGLILEMGAWILREACHQVMAWREQEPLRGLLLSANLSPRQLADPLLVPTVEEALAESGLPSDHLWLEMTEHVFLEEDETTTTNVLALRATGVHLAIDDFGTGYSSLAYLRRFPVDGIKIDRSFITGLDTDLGDQAIVTAIIRLGEALGLGVVAEGVERPQELATLEALGCRVVQGLLFGGAQPPEAALRTLLSLGR